MASLGASTAPCSNESSEKKRRRALGCVKDAVNISDQGVSVGFSIARKATDAGFGITNWCLRTSASYLNERQSAGVLRSAAEVLDLAHQATRMGQNLSESVTHASLGAVHGGLQAAGAEEGALLRATLGQDAADAILVVNRMVCDFTAQIGDVQTADLARAAQAWSIMQQAAAADRHEQPCEQLPENCERWMRFGAATFGSTWLSGFVEGASLNSISAIARAYAARDEGSGASALACAGVDGRVEVLSFQHKTTDVYAPGYLVAIDHETGHVIVALRGTSSLSDALTDLVCQPTPVQLFSTDGFAHDGMWRSANGLDTTLSSVVQQGIGKLTRPARVLICGHSLGAGTGALLAALWRDRDRFPGVDVRCVAFACPQVLDDGLARMTHDMITSIVLGDDLVPRLSLASSIELREVLLCLVRPHTFGLSDAFTVDAIMASSAGGEQDRLSAAYDAVRRATSITLAASGAPPQHLRPPGRLILLPTNGAMPSLGAADDVGELLVSADMAAAHMPHRYLRAVRATSLRSAGSHP